MAEQLAFFEEDLFAEVAEQRERSEQLLREPFTPPAPSEADIQQWLRVGIRQQQEALDKRLRAAAACGFEGIVASLLELGANPNAHDSKTGWVRLF